MKKDKLLARISVLVMTLLAFSCQQLPDDDAWMEDDAEESLKVEVRSADGVEIVYPLNLYAFDGDGKLVASQTVDNSEEEMALPMPRGDYKVVALSGDSEQYQVPKNPRLDDTVVMNGSEGASTPLMMGQADIDLSRSAENKAKLTLTHVVAALNVTLKNVPADVSAVQLALSPLYSSLTMGGEYGGDSQKVKVECISETPGVWAAETTYIFPGSGKETVFSISFRMENGAEVTYGYTYKGVPEANKPFNVTGSYSDGVIVGGSFDVNGWEEGVEIDFEFGGSAVPDDEEEDADGEETPETNLTGVPEIGSIWNDMIVVDIAETDDSAVDLLLMTLDEWEVTTSQVADVISGYSINGILDWRLPEFEEAKLLRSRFSGNNRLELNDLIAEYDDGLYGLDGEERYLCLKNGTCYSFKFAGGTTISKAGDVRSYYLRLVKTYRFVPEG